MILNKEKIMLRRMTTQKKIVYETLDSLGHASVEEIIDKIRMQHQQISLATIYRNIQALMEENKIKKVKLKNQDVLETINKDHGHFVCEKFKNIWDIEVGKDELIDEASKFSMHQLKQCDITFYGICHNCKLKGEIKK